MSKSESAQSDPSASHAKSEKKKRYQVAYQAYVCTSVRRTVQDAAPQVIASLSQLDRLDQAAPAPSGLSWPLSDPLSGFLRWHPLLMHATA